LKYIVFKESKSVKTIPPTLEICLKNSVNDDVLDQVGKEILSKYSDGNNESISKRD